MSKNIVLAGLQYDNNLGDQAIYMCAYKMLQKLLISHGICDMEIRKVDLTGRYAIDKNTINRPFRYLKKLYTKIGYRSGLAALPKKEARYVCNRLARRYIDSDTAAVIFAGGGIVKYKYQEFHIYIDEFTKRADKLGVPVMMNAVGVEGYDENDPECMLLKRALNRDCVKYISTRDDIDTLSGKYCENNQVTELVADPVCSLSFLKPLRKKPHTGRIIGLGTVRSGLFVDNDIDFTREDMLKFWSLLVREIQKRGMQCRVFCNGTTADMQFLNDLAKYMGLSDTEKKELMYERPTSVGQLARYINGFDAVITGDKVTHGKPDPEIYLTAASLLGTDPKECIAFEDSRNGLRSAYRAGMYPIQIPDLVPPGVESDALSWKTFPSLVEAREFLCGWLEA